MNVIIKFSASFREKWGEEVLRKCRPGSSIIDLITAIGIPDNESFTIMLNGSNASMNDQLHEGDTLSLMPLAAEIRK
ncbi:MAG: MoaD/ThiS family protein [Deltaproteobacteria bacterium]|nr:MoaD/ThiS family protein [Deltaproteobacteria bacterium]